jgi:hypothetical protein
VRLPRKSISAEHSDDYYNYSDPRVPSAEVILADIRASRLDYKWNSWATEYVLGWIAYREIDKFRLLSLPNLAAAASADQERRLGVKHIHPDVELLTALRQGKLIARPSIEVMHLGYPNPFPPDWWKDRTLSEAPRLRFVKDEVIKLWTADGSASSIVARGASTPDIASASSATIDPWEPSTKLTVNETKVIVEAKRHWPDCKCFLKLVEVYEKLTNDWDKIRMGDCVHTKTMERALRKIPAWNNRRAVNLGTQNTVHLAVNKTLE